MYPMRPPLRAFGPGTTSPLASRVSSPTSFQTPANRLFAARMAAAGSILSAVALAEADWAETACVAASVTMPMKNAMTARIRSPSTHGGHRLERHDIDPLGRVLPGQHTFHLHLMPRIRRALPGDAEKRKRLCAERLRR